MEHLISGATGQQVLDHVCRDIEARVPDSVCSIMVLDRECNRLEVQSAPCVPGEVREQLNGLVPGPFAGTCGTAVYQGSAVLVEDTSIDPRWKDLRELARKAGIRSCWSVPVASSGTILGTFAISRSVTGLPSDELLELLEAAGFVVGLAIQRVLEQRRSNRDQGLVRAIIDDTGDCIWVKGLDGTYVFANAAVAMTCGRTPAEMMGLRDEDLYPDALARLNRETDEEVVRTGKAMTYVATLGDDAAPRIYHVRKHPQLDEQGRVTAVIGVARDVTEQETAQRSLQRKQKLESLGLLAGGIAHDFNNLLVGILGNADWLLDHTADDGHREALEEVRSSARQASLLTNQMLDYAGRGGRTREQVRVPDLVRDVLDLVKGTIGKRAAVRVSMAERLPQVIGDPTRLRQVLMNLIVNASEALGGRPGTIVVRAETVHAAPGERPTVHDALAPGHYVEISVEDDGRGMDSDTLARMFDPFFTTKADGRGLGLAAVLGILQTHGGAIDVASAPGRGTRFIVYLPVQDGAGAGTSSEPRCRVLVVDDEALVRSVTRRLLDARGFEVVEAGDGFAALSMVEDAPDRFDVALVDQNMPRMTGLDLCRRLREVAPRLPVLLTTGGDDDEVDAGKRTVLRKPFTGEELREALGDVMEGDAGEGAQ